MRSLCLAVTIMALMATAMWAAPVPIFNTRPVAIDPAASGEPSLQQIIDTVIWPGGGVSATLDQSPAGMFQTESPYGPIVPAIKAEFTGNLANQAFGIFAPADDLAGNRNEAILFMGSDTGLVCGPGACTPYPTTATLSWYSPTALTVDVRYGPNAGDTRFTNVTGIPYSSFGFFFDVDGLSTLGDRYYTVDGINPQNRPRVLAIQRAATTNWAFAFEDGGDFDYQDMVVKVESIQAVPEPASVILLGTLMLGIGGLVRRRMTR